MNYSLRSPLIELIDQPDIGFADWAICLRELNTINTWLGGHAITISGVKQFIRQQKRLTIAEIGCGGGDNLKAVYRWTRTHRLSARFVGIDINEACIDFAISNCREIPSSEFIVSDYRLVDFKEQKPDIIFSSLFCHHFSDEQLVVMLRWLRENAALGFFINDLHRHPLAFYSIKWLTRFFSHSYLVKHDAPVSVLRGFKRREWERLLSCAGIGHYSIRWKWAFRYLVSVRSDVY